MGKEKIVFQHYKKEDIKIEVRGLDMEEVFKALREYTKEIVPDSDFLKFVEDKDYKPVISTERSMFVITESVLIMKNGDGLMIEFGEADDVILVTEDISYSEFIKAYMGKC